MSRFLPRVGCDRSSIDAAKTPLLAANELFKDLDADDMARVAEMTEITTSPAGQTVFGPENTGEVRFFLKQGRIQIYNLNADGKKLVLHDLKPGSFFGGMFTLGQGMADNYAESTEDSVICAMSRSDVYALLEARPDARLALVLLRECDPSDHVVCGLSQQDLAERVGATRESVTRLLNQMARDDIVKIGRRKITLLDPERVRRLVEQSNDASSAEYAAGR